MALTGLPYAKQDKQEGGVGVLERDLLLMRIFIKGVVPSCRVMKRESIRLGYGGMFCIGRTKK